MDFGERHCMLCGKEGFKADMVRMSNTVGGLSGWTCKRGECALPSSESREPTQRVPLTVVEDPLQEEFGFTKPEDGSERRFVFNAVKQGQSMPWQDQKVTVPWVKFRFWWLVHNAVAHPLIAVAPRRRFFEFHDYTSRKMHGK